MVMLLTGPASHKHPQYPVRGERELGPLEGQAKDHRDDRFVISKLRNPAGFPDISELFACTVAFINQKSNIFLLHWPESI